jgi:hypothetical protein
MDAVTAEKRERALKRRFKPDQHRNMISELIRSGWQANEIAFEFFPSEKPCKIQNFIRNTTELSELYKGIQAANVKQNYLPIEEKRKMRGYIAPQTNEPVAVDKESKPIAKPDKKLLAAVIVS